MKKLILIIIAICALAACNNTNSDAIALLHKAQAMIETDLDSALVYLDSLAPISNRLNKTQHYEYIIAKTQAKYKNYEDVTQDTAIFEARKFFDKSNDYKQRALAIYYSGCVYHKRKEYDKAMETYKEAFDATEFIKDTLGMGKTMQMIGNILTSTEIHNEALVAFQKAAKLSESYPQRKAEYYGNIGRSYFFMGNQDSSIFYLQNSIDLAKQSNFNRIVHQSQLSLANAYFYYGMNEEALTYLRQAHENDSDSIFINQHNLLFINLFTKLNQHDSVEYYVNSIKENLKRIDTNSVHSIDLVAHLYKNLAQHSLQNKEYDSVLYYQQKSIESFYRGYEIRMQQAIYDVQQKYDFEAEQNKHNQQLLKRQRRIIILSIALLVATSLTIIFGIKSFKKVRETSNLMNQLFIIQQENTKLNELQDKLNADISDMKQEISNLETQNINLQNETKINEIRQQISNLKSELDKSTTQLKENIMWRASLLSQIAKFENISTNPINTEQSKYLKKIIIGNESSSWDALLKLLNKTYPKLIETVKNIPELNDTEFRICILTFINLSSKEIANILNIGQNTVFNSRSSIRKKIKAEDISGAIFKLMTKN